MVDRKLLKTPNGLILGTPGSGKSFSAKRDIANCFLLTSDAVSYTHLLAGTDTAKTESKTAQAHMLILEPVSYTHLDVYKRQSQSP